MPTSQAIGRDFSKCTFRTLVPNLPAGIRRMLNRALNSFGTDLNVLPRWSEPVITAKGTKLEREFFPHASNDICCADGVAFCLYQTGVVDFGHDKDYFKSQIAGAIHWAHYYTPTKKNEDICYLVEDIPNTTDPNTIDFRSWLPGDYFVFFDATGDQGADHVNIYLGPFIETVNGEDIPDPVYHMFNSSIGTTGGNAVCTPGPFANHLRYCRSVNRRMWRCRVYAVERLFQNMIGPPVMLAEPTEKPKPGTPPRSELLWSWSERADAPYPVGRSLTWHDGIHLLKEEGMENEGVQSFAPGEIALVRFGKATSGGDTSLVLLRHRFLASQMRVLGPPPPPEKQSEDDPAAGESKPFFSLSMNLAPLSTYLAAGTEIIKGIPALKEPAPPSEVAGAAPVSDQAAGEQSVLVPDWLRRIWLKPKPPLIKQVPEKAQITLLALTRGDPDGTPKLAVLGQPKGLTTRHAYPLKDLQSETIGGKTYTLLPTDATNAAVWNEKVTPVAIPKGRSLVFYNPHPDVASAFSTSFKLPGETLLAYTDAGSRYALQPVAGADSAPVTGPQGTLFRVATFAPHEPAQAQALPRPGIRIGNYLDVDGDKDQYDHDREAGTLEFHESVRKLILYADTSGQDGARRLVDDFAIDITKLVPPTQRKFVVTERPPEPTGPPRKKADNVWLTLDLGVWLTDKERDQIQSRLNDVATFNGIKQRLAQNRSGLVGVKVSQKAGWEMRDGFLSPTEEKPEGELLTLYRKIKNVGERRQFEEPPKEASEAGHEMVNWMLTLEMAPELEILPVLTPRGKAPTAVFELILATTEEGTNQADLDAVEEENKRREPLVRKLLDGKLVDFSAEDALSGLRQVGREPIGRMGDVPAPLPGSGFVKGVHFEIFSGENLMDPAVTGDDKQIVPVPRSSWLVYKDTSTSGFFSPDFVNRLVDQIQKYPTEQLLSTDALHEAFGADGVVQPREWLEFCKSGANHRALSRLITVHVPEWKVDWNKELKAEGTRGKHLSEEDAARLAEDLKEHRWWENVSLKGITGETLFFYHPLRFIEWLSTGLDILIGGLEAKGAKPKVSIKLLSREGQSIDLSPDSQDPFLFRFRTMVGEAATELRAELTLDNVDTAIKTFRVTIRRGEVNSVRLVQPTVTVSTQNEQPWMEYAIPVAQKPVDTNPRSVYLLADGNQHLKTSGYSKSTLVFIVNYNVRIPDQARFKLTGTGFSLRVDNKAGITGAKWSKFEDLGTSAGGTVAPEEDEDTPVKSDANAKRPAELPVNRPEEMLIRGAKSYSIVVDVFGSTTTIGASATLEATFSGGDFPSERKKTCTVSTRELAPVPTKGKKADFPRGEDVGKLQLYLSQICDHSRLPCYRDLGNNKEYDALPLQKSVVDGVYKKSLAKAIWRFVYEFGTQSGFQAWPIRVRDAGGKDMPDVTYDQITAPVQPPLRDFGFELLGSNDKNYSYYPVVTAKLLAEIVRRFKPPFILPWIDLVPQGTSVADVAPEGAKVTHAWNESATGRTPLLPVTGDAIRLQAKWDSAQSDGVGDQPLPLTLELPAASAYRFSTPAGPVATVNLSLRELLNGPALTLVFSGTFTTVEADNVLKISTEGARVVAAEKLLGARDLTKRQSDSCRDAALVQAWLSRIPDPDPKAKIKSLYKNQDAKTKSPLIDGKWNQTCVQSLEAFKKLHAPAAADWKSLAAALHAEFKKHLTP